MERAEVLTIVARVMREQTVAALGTLLDGEPFVSMVLFLASPDLGRVYTQTSKLAIHTQNMSADPRVGLMITDMRAVPDPQTLPRVSLNGIASLVHPLDEDYQDIRLAYVQRFPFTAFNFTFNDFAFYRIQFERARLVAGFGRIFDLLPADLAEAGSGGG